LAAWWILQWLSSSIGDDVLLRHRSHVGHSTLPAFILLAIMTALGVGLWLSALNVKYRDVRYTIQLPDSVLAVCNTGSLFEFDCSGTLARSLRTKPDGRGG